jgi:hypothetical protein
MRRIEFLIIGMIALGAAAGAATIERGPIHDGAFVTAIVFALATAGLIAAAAVERFVDRPVHNPNLPVPVPARSTLTRRFRVPRCSDCGSAMNRAGTLFLCARCDRAPI